MLAETHHRLLSSLHASTTTSTRRTRSQSSNKSGFVSFTARRLRFGTKRNTSRFRAWGKPISSSTTKDETTTETLRKDDDDEEKGAVFQGVYEFAKHRCYYERKGDLRKAKVHVIFLHGFGVGTFHYRKQLNALSDEEVCAWSMDICGQGKSWPRSGEDVRDFEYSMDSWRDQVEYFVREVVLKSSTEEAKVKVVLAGNSLGGKLALYVAATSEDITDGIILLNATPFWGFLEKRVRFLTKENEFIVKLTQPYWDNFRSKENVRRLLTLVYADKTKIEESLIENIIEPTENEFAIRAFISTFTSPKASRLSYDEMLETIRDRNESMFFKVALCYGREDPWVVPLWGQRLKRVIKNATYYELSPSGHCPNDETPEAVNAVVRSLLDEWFLNTTTTSVRRTLPKQIDGVSIELVDGSPRNVFEKVDYWKDTFVSKLLSSSSA